MGGRGARFDLETSKRNGTIEKVAYGTTYKSLAQDGIIKIIQGVKGSNNYNKSPLESKTPNRIYGYVNTKGKLDSIVFMNKKGKKYKEIDWGHKHNGSYLHVHIGVEHKRNLTRNKLSKAEKRIYNQVMSLAKSNGIEIWKK